MFANAWRFRDYVIDSYNGDVPFDRFTTEQIAGDLLDHDTSAQRNRQLIASGFLELGPTNYEQQDKALLRMDVIDEQIDTIGRAFLGMTIGCARCHDHKFDPIPTTDYYAMAGILGSTQVLTPGNVSGYVEQDLLGPQTDAWHAHRERTEAVDAELQKLRAQLAGSKPPTHNIERADLAGLVLDDAEATLIGQWKLSTYAKGYLDAGYLHDEDRLKGDKSATFTPQVPADGLYEVRLSYTSGSNRASNVPVTVDAAGAPTTLTVDQRHPPPIDGWFVSLGHHRFVRGMGGVVTVATTGTDGHVIVDALQLIPVDGSPAIGTKEAVAATDQRRLRARTTELEAQLKALADKAPAQPPRAMAPRDVEQPADGHVHIRGDVRRLGPAVSRGFVRACSPATAHISEGESGRRQLARWLVGPARSLTARVYVNRVWHHMFGAGIVRTTDNFGTTGEPPSHPALLDWLARSFIEHRWSTKALVRAMARSHVYAMCVEAHAAADPENRLLAHANRRRLDAEAIRDAILSISGQLDLTAGGGTIRKMAEYDYGYEFDTLRRSVYVPRFRNSVLDLFAVFDAANPSMVVGRRFTSNVPAQALYMMNSSWVIEQARHAAARLLTSPLDGRDARIERAWLITLGRPPIAAELAVAHRHLAATDLEKGWADLFHGLFASLDFRYSSPGDHD